MAIYLPATTEEEQIGLDELTPREIVAELDKHVVGQHAAKRSVAIALRNRMRRQKLTPELAEQARLLLSTSCSDPHFRPLHSAARLFTSFMGALISFEDWHRQYLDSNPIPDLASSASTLQPLAAV